MIMDTLSLKLLCVIVPSLLTCRSERLPLKDDPPKEALYKIFCRKLLITSF